MKKNAYYFPELDTLRFLAFLLVLIHHGYDANQIIIIPWQVVTEYGWIGVDLFLCLSAFLFTRLLFVEFNKSGEINVRKFLAFVFFLHRYHHCGIDRQRQLERSPRAAHTRHGIFY